MSEILQSRTEKYLESIKEGTDIFKIVKLYKEELPQQLELKEQSELLQLLTRLRSTNSVVQDNPLPIYYLQNFEQYLSKEAKKVYLRDSRNTVYEYLVCSFRFWPFYKWVEFDTSDKFVFSWLVETPITNRYQFYYRYYKRKLRDFFFTSYLKHSLVAYISLEGRVDEIHTIEYYSQKLGKLYNHLVKKDFIWLANLNKVMLVQIHNSNIICFNIFPVSKNCGPYEYTLEKTLNERLGFDVFVREGESIPNFDWTLLDKL